MPSERTTYLDGLPEPGPPFLVGEEIAFFPAEVGPTSRWLAWDFAVIDDVDYIAESCGFHFRQGGSAMRRLWLPTIALLVSACGGGGAPGSFPPIDPNRLGIVIPGAAGAHDIECRAIEVKRCEGIAEAPPGNVDPGTIERIVVSCEGPPCTETDGAFRIDLVTQTGETTQIGRGGYGNAQQPTPPPAN
jgi:hypothetical protein